MARLCKVKGLNNEAAKSDTLPFRLKVLNWGKNSTLKGDVVVNKTTEKVFAENQKATGREEIVLDFEHNTVPGTEEYNRTKEPREVAAHGTLEIIPGDGVYMNMSRWTDSGRDNAKNYPDLSPAVTLNDEGVLIGMHSVALTRAGAVNDLTFLHANTDMEAEFKILNTGIQTPDAYKLALQPNPPKATEFMSNPHADYFRKCMSADMPDMALKADDAVWADLEKMHREGSLVFKKVGPLDNAGGTKPEIVGYAADAIAKIIKAEVVALTAPLSASLDSLTKSANDAAAASEQREREALVAQASRDGKVVPLSAETIKITPLAVLREMVAGLKKSVPTERLINLSAGGKPPTELKGLARTRAAFQEQGVSGLPTRN